MRELFISKIQPQDTTLEKAVLGAILIDKEALISVIGFLPPDAFYDEANKTIYESIKHCFASAISIDILTITHDLRTKNKLDIVGGAYYISCLPNQVANAAHILDHAKILYQKYAERELIRINTLITTKCYDGDNDVFALLNEQRVLLDAIDTFTTQSVQHISDILKKTLSTIEISKKDSFGIVGIESGLENLDRITGGWRKSDLIILAARPAMGKTSLAISFIRYAASYNIPSVFFSLEMSSEQLSNRLLSSETGINNTSISRGMLDDSEMYQIVTAATGISKETLFIDDSPVATISSIRSKLIKLKYEKKIAFAVVDYLQLMGGENQKNTSREQEISQISRGLKILAKELNIPIIALSQLSRAVETRSGAKRPILSDLRESGSIEQDADMVMFLYRPEYYGIEVDENNNSTKGLAELIIAKHRNGALDTIKLNFQPHLTKFTDYTEGNKYFPTKQYNDINF
jgi:replicative DNA helicase